MLFPKLFFLKVPKDPNPSNVGAFKLRPHSENTFVLITPQLFFLSVKEYISTTKTSWGLELGYKFAQVAMRSCFQVTKKFDNNLGMYMFIFLLGASHGALYLGIEGVPIIYYLFLCIWPNYLG